MAVDQGQLYRFGGFVLDTNENVLLSEGKPVSISPKALHLLSVLVADHGRIVEKERLMSEVWADSFVEDSNLTFTIRKLRQALGDDAHQPKFIETVPRRGYRFVAQVDLDGEDLAEPDPIVDEAALLGEVLVINPKPSAEIRKSWSRRPLVFAGSIGLVLIVLSGIGYGVFRLVRGNAPATFAEAEVSRLTSHGNVQAAAISPDGKFIVYTLNENTRHSLWLKNIANGGSVPIDLPPEMAFITNLIFAPDGDSIYFGHRTSLYRFPIPAGVPTKVLDQYRGGDYNAITFSPDGKQFAFLSYGVDAESNETASIIVYDTTLSSERVLATSKRPALFYARPRGRRMERSSPVPPLTKKAIRRLSVYVWRTERSFPFLHRFGQRSDRSSGNPMEMAFL